MAHWHFKNVRMRRILLFLPLGLTVAALLWQMVFVFISFISTSAPQKPTASSRTMVNLLSANAPALGPIFRRGRFRCTDPEKYTYNRTKEQPLAENLFHFHFEKPNDLVSNNKLTTNRTIRKSSTLQNLNALKSTLSQRSPHEHVCRLYEHLDLPASHNTGPQYTYRYRHVRVLRAPDRQHLCNKDTQVFIAINSAVAYFDRRNAVCIRFRHQRKSVFFS